jgi:hypothetical protein
MTTPSVLAELNIRNASLLARSAPNGMGVFMLQPTSSAVRWYFLCDNHGV